MRGGALPPALLCAALGFALAFAPRRVILPALLALAAPAAFIAWLRVDPAWMDAAFVGCWISIIVAAASVHLPQRVSPMLAMVLAINTGVWVGAVIAVAGVPLDLAKSIPLVLICLPGAWLVGKGRQIVLKVGAGWLIAIALLVATLPMVTPTPGYVADHMN